ncbi:hypothetical protein KQI14_10250 [Staphylococcus capitis]|uniref:hypothetical protein n=1 Tax=Staphylococcus capitis TaxID=29388 RepID=UPI001C11374A|nr:hypothetical protein [Staphylococcus capitis]MBU5292083.1 hypothetical protein [Staphylococcus capitis]
MSYDDELNFLKKIISVIYERMTNYADTFVELRNNKINFKKKCVCDFLDDKNTYIDSELLDNVVVFKEIVKKENRILLIDEELELEIDKRIKNERSIYNKLLKYQAKNGKGKYPIIKCLNDLLGYRFTLQSDIDLNNVYNILNEYVYENFNGKIKIVDASKNDYKAIHLYFKIDNFCFPCELQIWLNKDHKNNKKLHKIYKQDYLNWEEYESELEKK